jgi:hypothetical protein
LYAVSNKVIRSFKKETIQLAAMKGHFEIARFFFICYHHESQGFSKEVMDEAAAKGQFESFLHKYRKKILYDTCHVIRQLQMDIWLSSNFYMRTERKVK